MQYQWKEHILVNLGQFKVKNPNLKFFEEENTKENLKRALCSGKTSNKCLNKSPGRSVTTPNFVPYWKIHQQQFQIQGKKCSNSKK